MCGICGIYGANIVASELRVFQMLLFINELRGAESTGVLRVTKGKNSKIDIYKDIIPSSQYLRTKTGKDFVNPKDMPYLMIGHTRSSTRGEISVPNAHPFTFPNVVGVHNGTLHYTSSFEKYSEFGTDSEALYYNINQKGIEKALEDCVDWDGAYALAYIDRREDKLCFIRNNKRPLYFTFIAGGTTLIWSSMREHLELACQMANFTPEGLKKDWPNQGDTVESKFFTLNENDRFSIKIGQPARSGIIEHLDIKKRVQPVVSNYYGSSHKSPYEGSLFADDWEDWAAENLPNGKRTTQRDFYKSWVEGPDGVWRDKENDARFRSQLAIEQQFKKSNFQDALDGIEPEEGDQGNLTDIPWLNGSSTTTTPTETKEGEKKAQKIAGDSGKNSQILKAETRRQKKEHNEPQSHKELVFKLSRGCSCCGTVVDPNDEKELSRVRWISRDGYACGDCYDSEDWIRTFFEDNWREFENLPPQVTTLQ